MRLFARAVAMTEGGSTVPPRIVFEETDTGSRYTGTLALGPGNAVIFVPDPPQATIDPDPSGVAAEVPGAQAAAAGEAVAPGNGGPTRKPGARR